jgi:hypothetical protein
MKTSKARSSKKRIEGEGHVELLGCRAAMLGLDLSAFEGSKNAIVVQIMRRCADCSYREACAADVKRDPNDPVWEAYCPNAEALLQLADESWQRR